MAGTASIKRRVSALRIRQQPLRVESTTRERPRCGMTILTPNAKRYDP